METGNVSLQISKEIVNPIVKSKIESAVLEAMGGSDVLIEKFIDEIFKKKVDINGQVSSYSSSNTFNWLEMTVTNQIKKAVEEAAKEIIASRQEDLKQSIIKLLSTKKGIEQFAEALIKGTIQDKYRTNIQVSFDNR